MPKKLSPPWCAGAPTAPPGYACASNPSSDDPSAYLSGSRVFSSMRSLVIPFVDNHENDVRFRTLSLTPGTIFLKMCRSQHL